MNMRVFVAPPWQSVMARALGTGACYGAAIGAATLVAVGLGGALAAHSTSSLAFAVFFSPIAAIVGAGVGLVCGLIGGLALTVLRRQAVRRRAAARLIAGTGAALLPATWLVLPDQPGDLIRAIALGLTFVTFGVGAASGPHVLYGRSRRPVRRVRADEPGMRP
jgi:hypothetical protein